MISISLIVYSFLAFVGLFIFFSSFMIVKQQQIAIVETLGKFSKTLGPGFHLVIPIIQRVSGRMSMKIQEIQANVEIKTKDNTFVNLPVSIHLVPNENKVQEAFYKLDDPEEQITRWILNSIRAIASDMNLDDLFTDKEHIINQVRESLVEKIKSYGYDIEAVLIDQPALPPEVQDASNRVMKAKRDAEAATKEGEALRIKIVAQANAEAESQRIRAQGLADSREILAKGLNDSIQKLEEKNIDPIEAVKTLVELSRLDVIRESGHNGNTIIFDLGGKEISNKEVLGLVAKKNNE